MPTIDETQILCYNCFHQHDSSAGPCPNCGFDLSENEKKFPVALRAGTVLNDRYVVGRVLGQGGFGITYLALDTKLNARVAVKEYMPNEIATRIGTTVSVAMDSRSADFTFGAERFQEEAQTLAKFIGHPNIAGVSDRFDENDTSYFVMDYIEGVSFKSYIESRGGQVSVDDTLNVMIPVLRALTAVHAEDFIHRDVTPDNIYISKDGNVKLLDFGSARYSIGDKSKSLDVILKVGYAPKEQYIRRGRQGPYTDVYSCAACFYAAITGYLPPESLERLDQDTLVPISQAGFDIPEWLDKAILKGLAVQPEDRFQSAAEFLDAIENQLVVEVPVKGQAVQTPPEKKKISKPMIAGIAAAALAVVIGIGALGGGGGSGNHGGNDNGLRNPNSDRYIKPEVPSITIQGKEYSTDAYKLELENAGLTDDDLKDLHYMVNLDFINLNGNPDVTDISFVTELPMLEDLHLRETGVTDLSPLTGLTRLETLQFGGSYWDTAVDLTPLGTLTDLDYLSLPANMPETDLSPLASLTNLTGFSFDGNNSGNTGWINDLTFLSGMSKVDQLYLNVGELTSLKGLEGMTSLATLNLSGPMRIEDLSPLSGLTELQELYLYGSGNGGGIIARDLTPLSGLTELRELHLSAENVESLRGLEGMTKLTKLQLYNSGSYDQAILKDISALAGLTELTELRLYLSAATKDFSPLAGLTKLATLEIYGEYPTPDYAFLTDLTELRDLRIYGGSYDTPRKDLSFLQNLTELKNLSLTVGALESLTGLENLTELQEVHLNGNDATYTDTTPLLALSKVKSLSLPSRDYDNKAYCDLSGFAGMTSLQELSFSGHIRSLEPLAGLTNLKSLDISDRSDDGEPRLDLTPLSGLTGLQELRFSGRVSGVDFLSGLTNLKTLSINDQTDDYLSDPPLDLTALGNLTNVTELTLYSYRTTDLSDVGNMTGLRTLNLSMGSYRRPVPTVAPLANLTELTKATLYLNNDNMDWSPVSHVASLTTD